MKKILMLFFILFFTGCTAQYKISVDYKNSFQESVEIILENSKILDQYKSIDDFLRNVIDPYKNSNDFYRYSFHYIKGKNTTSIRITSPKQNKNQMESSPLLGNIFEETLITGDKDINIFRTVGDYYYDRIYSETGDGPEIRIHMHFQNVVEEQNADLIDSKNNNYTWILNGDSDTRNIYVRYSNKRKYDIILLDIVKNNWIVAIFAVLLLFGILLLVWKFFHGIKLANDM